MKLSVREFLRAEAYAADMQAKGFGMISIELPTFALDGAEVHKTSAMIKEVLLPHLMSFDFSKDFRIQIFKRLWNSSLPTYCYPVLVQVFENQQKLPLEIPGESINHRLRQFISSYVLASVFSNKVGFYAPVIIGENRNIQVNLPLNLGHILPYLFWDFGTIDFSKPIAIEDHQALARLAKLIRDSGKSYPSGSIGFILDGQGCPVQVNLSGLHSFLGAPSYSESPFKTLGAVEFYPSITLSCNLK